jgi:MFS family permease
MRTHAGLFRDPRLYIVFGITLTGVMGVSVISPALPKISRVLSLSSREVGLLITVFTIPGIIIAPTMGFLADRVGRKKIVIPSLFLFALAGSACAAAPSFPLLLLLRTLQGFGAAALTSLSVTLLGDMYEGSRRDAAVGFNASVLSIGTAVYPALGGLLASLDWHFPFLLSAVGLPIGLAALFLLHSPSPRGSGSPLTQLKRVLDNALRSGILFISLLAILQFILLYGVYLTYVPFLLEERFSADTGTVGLLMSTMSLSTAFMASQNRRLAARSAPRMRLAVAFVLIGGGLVLFATVPTLLLVPLATIVYGLGQGIIIPTVQGTIASRTPLELRGATLSVNAMAIRIGQSLGPVLSGAVYAAVGLGATFLSGAGVAVFVMFLALIGIGSYRDRGEKEAPLGRKE